MLKERITALLGEEKIDLFSFLSLSECKITKKYLLDRAGIESGSVIIMAVPYICRDFGVGNISEYAKPRDYHLYFSSLFSRLTKILGAEFPENTFLGFSDHSPIDERHAAALAGLGAIGKNGLLLTERYSSFVFLGEIITDAVIESRADEIKYCEDCGICIANCPVSTRPDMECLSALTQKKQDLNAAETEMIISSGTAWGCDACQLYCPYTKRASKNGTIFSPIAFFKEKRIPSLTYRLISEMSDKDFSERAYSWRGRQTILRNLSFLESANEGESTCNGKKKPN